MNGRLEHWRLYITLTLVAVTSIIAGGSGTAYFLTRNHVQLDELHNLTCDLDYLFGLDRALPPKTLKRLRPSQLQALENIIDECPRLRGSHGH